MTFLYSNSSSQSKLEGQILVIVKKAIEICMIMPLFRQSREKNLKLQKYLDFVSEEEKFYMVMSVVPSLWEHLEQSQLKVSVKNNNATR